MHGSQVVVLATPVGAIIDLIERLGPALAAENSAHRCRQHQRRSPGPRDSQFSAKMSASAFSPAIPWPARNKSGVEFADPDLFQGAAWFFTPAPGQKYYEGLSGEFLEWVEKIGARIASLDAEEHDQLCAWISHLPQMISTALAATLVDEFGEDAPLLDTGGRALREMTRISAQPLLHVARRRHHQQEEYSAMRC